MARRAKPTAAKVLQGTFRQDRAVKDEVKHEEVEDLTAPDWMEGLALVKWNELAVKLKKAGVLTVVDVHNLEAFCTAYATFRKAYEEVENEGNTMPTLNGGVQKNPSVTVMNEAMRNMVTYGSLLGLDPSSRTKISGKAGDKKDNPFAKL